MLCLVQLKSSACRPKRVNIDLVSLVEARCKARLFSMQMRGGGLSPVVWLSNGGLGGGKTGRQAALAEKLEEGLLREIFRRGRREEKGERSACMYGHICKAARGVCETSIQTGRRAEPPQPPRVLMFV